MVSTKRGQKKDSLGDILQVSAELPMGVKGLVPNLYTLLDILGIWFLPAYSLVFFKHVKHKLPIAEIIQPQSRLPGNFLNT